MVVVDSGFWLSVLKTLLRLHKLLDRDALDSGYSCEMVSEFPALGGDRVILLMDNSQFSHVLWIIVPSE